MLDNPTHTIMLHATVMLDIPTQKTKLDTSTNITMPGNPTHKQMLATPTHIKMPAT